MNYTKELDEKLRAFLRHTERCINFTLANTEEDPDDVFFYVDSVKALQLRKEIITLIDKPEDNLKWKQITIEEAINEEIKDLAHK